MSMEHKNSSIAKKVIEKCVLDGNDIVISEDILTTVYYVCVKNVSRKNIFNFFEM